MKIKALVSLIGKYNLNAGEISEITDKNILKDLLANGYVEEVKEEKKAPRKKKVNTDEN